MGKVTDIAASTTEHRESSVGAKDVAPLALEQPCRSGLDFGEPCEAEFGKWGLPPWSWLWSWPSSLEFLRRCRCSVA